MAVKTTRKAYITNLLYGVGAAIVILGALMKITHFDLPFLSANTMLTIGLITEAAIFLYSAFFDPPGAEYDWEKAYPELGDENAAPVVRKKADPEIREAEASLSSKLDQMLKEANLDSQLFESLRGGIAKFEGAVNELNKTTDATVATQKYGDQLALAANHMESLNALYAIQLDHGKKQVELNNKYIDDLQKSTADSEKFSDELKNLTENINNLNRVYGGMLSAMKS